MATARGAAWPRGRGYRALSVRRTVSSGELVELAKTSRSLRQVPVTKRALAALDAMPPRLDTPLAFPAPEGGIINLNNWRRREWTPAVKAAGVAKPARIYDLRVTYASEAPAAGMSVFELARSVQMIERSYGALLDGAGHSIAYRLDAYLDGRQDDTEASNVSDGA